MKEKQDLEKFEKYKELANKLASEEGWYLSGEFTSAQMLLIFGIYEYDKKNATKSVDEIVGCFGPSMAFG